MSKSTVEVWLFCALTEIVTRSFCRSTRADWLTREPVRSGAVILTTWRDYRTEGTWTHTLQHVCVSCVYVTHRGYVCVCYLWTGTDVWAVGVSYVHVQVHLFRLPVCAVVTTLSVPSDSGLWAPAVERPSRWPRMLCGGTGVTQLVIHPDRDNTHHHSSRLHTMTLIILRKNILKVPLHWFNSTHSQGRTGISTGICGLYLFIFV